MTERLTQAQIEFVHEYNGYERLGRSPEALYRLVQPAHEQYQRTGRVPDWCGTDLLRGWAFYLARADRHAGGYGSHDQEILDLLRAWEAATSDEDLVRNSDRALPAGRDPRSEG